MKIPSVLLGEVVYCREAGQLGYAMGIKFSNVPSWKRDVLGNLFQEFKENLHNMTFTSCLSQPPWRPACLAEVVPSVDRIPLTRD